jgi:hypothetical protein
MYACMFVCTYVCIYMYMYARKRRAVPRKTRCVRACLRGGAARARERLRARRCHGARSTRSSRARRRSRVRTRTRTRYRPVDRSVMRGRGTLLGGTVRVTARDGVGLASVGRPRGRALAGVCSADATCNIQRALSQASARRSSFRTCCSAKRTRSSSRTTRSSAPAQRATRRAQRATRRAQRATRRTTRPSLAACPSPHACGARPRTLPPDRSGSTALHCRR